MKYVITENQKERIALNWMNKNFSPDQLEIIESPKYPDSIFYKKNGKIVMKQDKKNKIFWFHYDEIYSFFKSFFGMKYEEWQGFMRTWLEEDFNLRGYTPKPGKISYSNILEEAFNLRGYTPSDLIEI